MTNAFGEIRYWAISAWITCIMAAAVSPPVSDDLAIALWLSYRIHEEANGRQPLGV